MADARILSSGGANMANTPMMAPLNGANIYAQGAQDRLTGNQQNDAAMQQLMAQLRSQGEANQLQAQTGLQQTGMQTSAATTQAQIAADASKYPTLVRSQEFQQLLPSYMQTLGTLNNAASSGFASGTGSGSGNQPAISAGPVWNPQQIKQQVNQSRASTDASTATQQRQNTQQNAGKGYSSNSPLLSMLNQSAQMAGNAQNAQSANSINWNAAQGNAQQQLQGQQAQEQQYSNRANEALKRQQNTYGLASSIYGALGGAMA